MPANESFSALNMTKISGDEDCFVKDSTAGKAARITAYCVLMITSLVGNSVVITVVWREARMRKTINFFIVNMCVADLLITLYMPRVVSISYAGFEWQISGLPGLIFCKLSVFMHQTAITASIFTVVAISCDRFFAVVFPLRIFITKKVCRIIIAVIWISSVSIPLPMLYALELVKVHGEIGKLGCFLSLDDAFKKGAEKFYYKFTLISLFAVPLSVIVILYSAILVTLKLRKFPGEETSGNAQREQRRGAVIQKKVLRLVLIVVAAFILCWLLYFIRFILYSYKIQVSCEVLFWRLFLAHFNSALNPCLYFVLNENFREGFKNILRQCPSGRHFRVRSVHLPELAGDTSTPQSVNRMRHFEAGMVLQNLEK